MKKKTIEERKEYLKEYYIKHKEDDRRRSREFRERRKQGIEADDFHYYNSIEELKEWEKENHKCINWDVWDKLVEETKLLIQEVNYTPQPTPRKTTNKPRYVYDTTSGRLIYKDLDVNIAAELAMTLEQIRSYCNSMKYIKYRNLLFANEFIPTWHVKCIINQDSK